MKSQYEIKVQSLKKRSNNYRYQKSIPNSDQNFRSFFLRLWIKIDSILIPKSVQELPKIDPKTHQEPIRIHLSHKSLPKTSQRPPKSLPRPPNDLPKSDFGSFFHPKKRASEPEISSQKPKFRRPAAWGLPH